MTRLALAAVTLATAAMLTGCAIPVTGTASPAPRSANPEQAFLTAMRVEGADLGGTPSQAIELARMACHGLGRGLNRSWMTQTMRDNGYSNADAAKFMRLAIDSFCPEYAVVTR